MANRDAQTIIGMSREIRKLQEEITQLRETPVVDATLGAVVDVLQVQVEYHTDMHGLNSPEMRTLTSVTYMLADKLYGPGTPERAAFVARIAGAQ